MTIPVFQLKALLARQREMLTAELQEKHLADLDEMILHHKRQLDRIAVALERTPLEGTHYDKHDMDALVEAIKDIQQS
jgi:hypothetical protein